MKIYVAGSSKQLKRVNWAQRMFRENGHSITYDWTKDFKAELDTFEQACKKCTQGIYNAQAVLVLIPDNSHTSIGAWVEMGISCALRASQKLYLVASGKGKIDIWKHALDQHFDKDQNAIRHICLISGEKPPRPKTRVVKQIT